MVVEFNTFYKYRHLQGKLDVSGDSKRPLRSLRLGGENNSARSPRASATLQKPFPSFLSPWCAYVLSYRES
jgi:hypothetical protein